MFVIEVGRQYEKPKKQFIPLPWKVRDFVFRSVNKINEFANHFHNLNLMYAEKIRGFDPNIIFMEHMLTMGFSNI
jgi:hypothetical protein